MARGPGDGGGGPLDDRRGSRADRDRGVEGQCGNIDARAVTGDDEADADEQLPGAGIGFGLGFAVGPGKSQYGHNGSDEGFQAYLTAFADSGSGVAIMANSDNGFMIFDHLAASIAKDYRWTFFDTRESPPAGTVSLLAHIRGAERAIAWYKSANTSGPREAFGPRVLNEAGYSLLRSGRTADAVRLFEANVALYPDDANAYDSLGEGQMAAGLKAEAIASYKKALQVNPANTNAVKMLEKLGVQWTPQAR